MGLMSFESRLIFLRKYCTYAPRDENYCYFQYIYEGLLKAANSGEIGNASYPGNNVYLRNKMAKYYHGYINYRGEHFPYDPEGNGELGSEEIAYHFEAMQLVFELVKQKLTRLSNLECLEPEHLASIFEANLGLNLDNEHQELESISFLFVFLSLTLPFAPM